MFTSPLHLIDKDRNCNRKRQPSINLIFPSRLPELGWGRVLTNQSIELPAHGLSALSQRHADDTTSALDHTVELPSKRIWLNVRP